jgi:hypothetical protein
LKEISGINDNIKMDRKEIGCEDVDWIQLAQDAVQYQSFVRKVINLQVALKAEYFFIS